MILIQTVPHKRYNEILQTQQMFNIIMNKISFAHK